MGMVIREDKSGKLRTGVGKESETAKPTPIATAARAEMARTAGAA